MPKSMPLVHARCRVYGTPLAYRMIAPACQPFPRLLPKDRPRLCLWSVFRGEPTPSLVWVSHGDLGSPDRATVELRHPLLQLHVTVHRFADGAAQVLPISFDEDARAGLRGDLEPRDEVVRGLHAELRPGRQEHLLLARELHEAPRRAPEHEAALGADLETEARAQGGLLGS